MNGVFGRPDDFKGVNLTDEEVLKFKTIYETKTGTSLSLDEARAKATKFMTFIHVLIRHSQEVDYDGRDKNE